VREWHIVTIERTAVFRSRTVHASPTPGHCCHGGGLAAARMAASGQGEQEDRAMAMWGKRDDMVVHESEPHNAEPPRAALAEVQVAQADGSRCSSRQ